MITNLGERCARVQALLYKEVPLSRSIGIRVHRYLEDRLELRADLAPNVNVHGTAFGGSLYSVCALAGWCLLVLKLEENDLDPRIMLAGAKMKYFKPVTETISATSYFSADHDFDEFVDTLHGCQKARLKIPVDVELETTKTAARFIGDFVALARR